MRLPLGVPSWCEVEVSIHAPREGCDLLGESAVKQSEVSIHAPREGCDLPDGNWVDLDTPFQFTHPGRGATYKNHHISPRFGAFQFTHPGRGATTLEQAIGLWMYVSIHAPREGCDT